MAVAIIPDTTGSQLRGRISVCMASHNGERYIAAQLQSILRQLSPTDEIVIVDDASTDRTLVQIDSLHDGRIRIFVSSTRRGVLAAFEEAISRATGEVIFLSDQDDLWAPGKVNRILQVFATRPRTSLVLTTGSLMTQDGVVLEESIFRSQSVRLGLLPTLIRNNYQGSAMAFRRRVGQAALPFPSRIPMHDSWIGLVNRVIGEPFFLDERLLYYRRHDRNVTQQRHGTALTMLRQRCWLAVSLLMRLPRLLAIRFADPDEDLLSHRP